MSDDRMIEHVANHYQVMQPTDLLRAREYIDKGLLDDIQTFVEIAQHNDMPEYERLFLNSIECGMAAIRLTDLENTNGR